MLLVVERAAARRYVFAPAVVDAARAGFDG
jgi:hypothetical protein